MSERWAPVVGAEGFYEVSDHGRVRRAVPGRGTFVGKIMLPRVCRKGYVRVALTVRSARRDAQVHRLVLESFVGPAPSERHQCNHINGRKSDNRLENLEWCTPGENVQHAVDEGLRVAPNGERHPKAKLTARDVLVIRLAPDSVTTADLARSYGVSWQSMSFARSGKNWRNLPTDPVEIRHALQHIEEAA